MNLYLIDATYELFRAFYGYPKRLSPKSIEIGAVRGLMEHVVRVRNNEENIILAGSNDNNLYAINSNGSLRFLIETGDNINTSPSFILIEENIYKI